MLIHKVVLQFVYADLLKSFTAHHSCPVSVWHVEVSHYKVVAVIVCQNIFHVLYKLIVFVLVITLASVVA